jgi:uncharacterized membrane protein
MQSDLTIVHQSGLYQVLYGIVFLSALGAAVTGGVFFAFSNFVMRAFDRLPPGEAIAAMNSINITVINPLFMAMLFGTGVLCAIDIAIAMRYWAPVGAGYLAAGAIVYLVTSIGVTMLGNVPLNVALAKAQSRGADDWARYRTAWTRWNHVRTIGCAAAAALIIQAMASGGLWYFLLSLRT